MNPSPSPLPSAMTSILDGYDRDIRHLEQMPDVDLTPDLAARLLHLRELRNEVTFWARFMSEAANADS